LRSSFALFFPCLILGYSEIEATSGSIAKVTGALRGLLAKITSLREMQPYPVTPCPVKNASSEPSEPRVKPKFTVNGCSAPISGRMAGLKPSTL
jgi:hypothetical protein